MNRILAALVMVILLNTNAMGQYRFETIHENQKVQLNSGSRSLVGGVSRSYLAINIPQGAIGIIYTVQSEVNYSAAGDIRLAAMLASVASGNIGCAAMINRIPLPRSNATIDVYSIPSYGDNLSMFLGKNDDRWVQYSDYACVSSLRCKRFVQVSDDMGGRIYLGLRNPSATNRIVAIVNVVAVFEQ